MKTKERSSVPIKEVCLSKELYFKLIKASYNSGKLGTPLKDIIRMHNKIFEKEKTANE